MKTYLNPPELFPSLQYGFSQGVVSDSGRMVHLSGQVAWDAQQQIVGEGDLREQVWQTLENLKTAMTLVGGALSDIVTMRIYIVDAVMEENYHVTEGLKAFFADGHPPATTWIGVQSLASKAFLIEIEAVAVLEGD